MKIVFMGTPRFAVPIFLKLYESSHEIVAVVTAPDKPAGRGQKMTASAIKSAAEMRHLPILQPERLDDADFIQYLRHFDAELFVVVAFRILPESVLAVPPRGAVNLHASLLPKYRGAAPINWALINGETETGVTTFFIDKRVDTGEILLQQSVPISEEMTAGELHDVLSEIGADVMLRTVDGIAAGTLRAMAQIGEITRAPKLTRELEIIDWRSSAHDLVNLIRGLGPSPGCSTNLRGRQVKLLRAAAAAENNPSATPGSVIAVKPDGLIAVQTGTGVIHLLELKPEGKKTLSAAEFIRGYRITVGEIFQ
jgi:methionyl-tRNA formyltransferase